MSEQKYNGMCAGKDAISDFISDMRKIQESAQKEPEQLDEAAVKVSYLKTEMDVNGNKVVRVLAPEGSYTFQTNQHAPKIHRGLDFKNPEDFAIAFDEVKEYTLKYGKPSQKKVFASFAANLKPSMENAVDKFYEKMNSDSRKNELSGLANKNELPEETQLDEEKEEMFSAGYKTYSGHIMTKAEADAYNQYTKEIMRTKNKETKDFLKDQRHRFLVSISEETQLDEVSPPSKKSKEWLEDPKVQAAFKKQYGEKYKEVMFAKAWKDFKEEVEPNFELEMMDESTFRDYSSMSKKDMDDLAAERRRKRERSGDKDSLYNKDGSHKSKEETQKVFNKAHGIREEQELDESFWYQDESDDELTEAEMFQKMGHTTYDGKVFVFYNINLSNKLGRPLWSIRNEKTGRIIGHDQGVVLRDAEFVVGQAGKEKVRDEKRKNVHAGVRGFIVHDETAQQGYGTAITYNPYKYDTFVSLPDETPVKSARLVHMLDKKVGATGVANYTEDELEALRGRAEKYKKAVNEDFNSEAAVEAIKKLAASGIEQEQLDEIFGLFKKKNTVPDHEAPEEDSHQIFPSGAGLPEIENVKIGRFTFSIWKNKTASEWYISGINRHTLKQVAPIAPASSRGEAIKNARAAIAIEMNKKEREAKMASLAMESVQLEEETQPINKKSSGDKGFMAYWDKKRKLVAVYAKDAKEARELLMKHYKTKSIWDFSSVMPTEDEEGKQIVHSTNVLEAKEYSPSKEERLGKQFDLAMSSSLKTDSDDWSPSMESVQVGRHTFVLWKHKSKNEWYGIAYLTVNGETHKTLETGNSKNAVVKALRDSVKAGADVVAEEIEFGVEAETVISNLLEKYQASGKSIEALDQLCEMASLKSKKALFDDLASMFGDDTIKTLGLKHKRIGNETYGKKSMVYVNADSVEQRKEIEDKLENLGYKVGRNYWKGSPRTEVQVSYFKGLHWDE